MIRAEGLVEEEKKIVVMKEKNASNESSVWGQ